MTFLYLVIHPSTAQVSVGITGRWNKRRPQYQTWEDVVLVDLIPFLTRPDAEAAERDLILKWEDLKTRRREVFRLDDRVFQDFLAYRGHLVPVETPREIPTLDVETRE